ncbi:MAG: VanZ family protein [Coprobacillus cateniformis]|uniref:VanZ family protein n=1 Tax=Longibaculum muris TaxID=1796628 RepID=UPI003AB50238|nr:VanZ family protein [Coprobacillus cateniformis]
MKKLKYFIPAIILMIIIFSFSQQTGQESSGLSSQIVVWIQTHLHITISEFFIRKAAHMSEYALLTSTFIYGFYHCDYSLKQILLFSLCATFLYACSDEVHQLFIGGRAGQWRDVLIDTSGGLIASIIYYFIHPYIKKTH